MTFEQLQHCIPKQYWGQLWLDRRRIIGYLNRLPEEERPRATRRLLLDLKKKVNYEGRCDDCKYVKDLDGYTEDRKFL